jgi:hypothetical protein
MDKEILIKKIYFMIKIVIHKMKLLEALENS